MAGGRGCVCRGVWGALGHGLQLGEVNQGVALDASSGCSARWGNRDRVSKEPPQRSGTSMGTGVPEK